MSGDGKYQGYATFQEFLDKVQYSKVGILSYEKIFGHTYVSTGGEDTTAELCADLRLRADSRVLDVGCGIGGSAFFLAKKFGCSVEGIDLSTNMLAIGEQRLAETRLQDKVTLRLADCTACDFPAESFDLVYSRDTILHIEDKLALFKNFNRWLKPGGQLLITDYCSQPKPWPEDYEAYVKQRGYHVMPVEDYGSVVAEAGFVDVRAVDLTSRFREVLVDEVGKIQGLRQQFVEELGEQMYQYILDGWNAKIGRVDRGAQRWGFFRATKNSSS